MPPSLKKQQDIARRNQISRRRTSIASTKDAEATLVQHQKDRKYRTGEGGDGGSGGGGGGSGDSGGGGGGGVGRGGDVFDSTAGKEVRVFRGLFNVSATSTKPPAAVLDIVQAALKKKAVPFKRVDKSFVLKCEFPSKSLRFEVEICKLPRLEEVCFVNMKRIAGETFAWKDFCTQFFASLQL